MTSEKNTEGAPFKDRVIGFERIKAKDLTAHPKNWRAHPEGQKSAVRAMLDDIGFAGAILARKLKDGTTQILDGHLRSELEPDAELPVLLLDLDDDEADKLLVTFDPLSTLAMPDPSKLDGLLANVELGDHAELRKLMTDLGSELAKVQRRIEENPGEYEHEVEGMPLSPHEHYDYVVVLCSTTHEWNVLCEKLDLKPERVRRGKMGVNRAIRAHQLLEKLG